MTLARTRLQRRSKPKRRRPTQVPRPLPRYRAIAAEIGRRIAKRTYAQGNLLPSEADLATEFGVTRMTVRNALAGLASLGLIERRHGHGTLVAGNRLRREAQQPMGLHDELVARGLRPGSRTIKLDEIRPSIEARNQLRLGSRATVIRFVRLRFADDILMGLQESLIPSRYCPGLLALDLTGASLTKLLREKFGLSATHADLTIEAVEATPTLGSALDIRTGSALLRSTRITFLADGRPLERTVGWFPGIRYLYHVRQGHEAADRPPEDRTQRLGRTRRR